MGAGFEDEGPAGYLYVWDHSRIADEQHVLDAMLIYNASALEKRERLASIQWSRSGMQAVLYIDGSAQALVDFATRESYCRSNFPNFLDGQQAAWRVSSHAWNQDALDRFEAEMYSEPIKEK